MICAVAFARHATANHERGEPVSGEVGERAPAM
jgi:hypothetical protein